MRLIPRIDGHLGRFDRWQTLGVVFDRPLAGAPPDPDPTPDPGPRLVRWFPGLSRHHRNGPRRLFRGSR
jgi:hypothetical protein